MGRVVSPTPTPLSSGRVGPALVTSYNMHGRAVGLFYTQPTSLFYTQPKWRSVEVSRTGTSGQADTAEEVGLDRTHPQEASIQHHMPSPELEPTGEEKERPASQQLEARHWSRAETAGDQLVRNDQSGPEQSAMAGGGGGGVVDGLCSIGSDEHK